MNSFTFYDIGIETLIFEDKLNKLNIGFQKRTRLECKDSLESFPADKTQQFVMVVLSLGVNITLLHLIVIA